MAFSRKEKLNNDLGKILKQRRVMVPLTLRELAVTSGVSSSHLGRIERGERFPSAHILRRIAKPLGCEETELLTLAGYLSH
jgi:transcriptional regulator with XRE-family HTH domain